MALERERHPDGAGPGPSIVLTPPQHPHHDDFLAFAVSMVGRREQATTAAEKLTRMT
jgi:hypothetical protein